MFFLGCLCSTLLGLSARAQETATDYQEVLKSLDRKGDFKAGVLKLNIPRSDLKMTIQGVSTPTPFGFGGWVALTKGTDAIEVMMGDLILLVHMEARVHSVNGIIGYWDNLSAAQILLRDEAF
jgi:Domain of Unknown Function (DUF1259)